MWKDKYKIEHKAGKISVQQNFTQQIWTPPNQFLMGFNLRSVNIITVSEMGGEE